MKYKLIASDMDGTLFDESYVISEENLSGIKLCLNNGVYFVLCTGRPLPAVTEFVKKWGLENQPIIINNGATVFYRGRTIYDLTLTEAQAKSVLDKGHELNMTMVAWSNHKFYAEKDCEYVRFYQKIPNIPPIFVDDLSNVDNITKIVWFNNPELTKKYHKEMKAHFNGEINVVPSRVDFLEFFSKDCSKAIALQKIGEELGISKEQMIAVGDGLNDIEMIEYAGLGVAMENASEEVKNASDFVTLSVKNNGVNALIDRFLVKNNG